MSNITTLTSLAMLKVNIDTYDRDYPDYLQPFIFHVLRKYRPSSITDDGVRQFLRDDFGLLVPTRGVQIVLRRMSRQQLLRRGQHKYEIVGDLPDVDISLETTKARRHIRAVASALIDLASDTSAPIADENEAVDAILRFLSEFSIDCLRSYVHGTTIPAIDRRNDQHIVLVSRLATNLAEKDPERFESFMVMVKGHMLANALLCPDLVSAPAGFSQVTFYLDTPLLVRLLGLEGEAKQHAGQELVDLLHNLSGTVALFSHTRKELYHVIRGAADHVNSPNGRGAIVSEMRRQRRTKSDLMLIAEQLDTRLNELRIGTTITPRYVVAHQIDEVAFGDALNDEITYWNPKAHEYDINSVRSIYVLRKGKSPTSVEKAGAVFVTSNAAFAKAAYHYGRDIEESREVSSVITDFSIANVAWLKAPMGAPDLPMKEVLAYSYAAMEPGEALWNAYLNEIDKLQEGRQITPRDHELLRCHLRARDELQNLTLGNEEELTHETISTILSRVESKIKEEEQVKLQYEQQQHMQTRNELRRLMQEQNSIRKRWYWRCERLASTVAWVFDALFVLGILVAAGISGYGLERHLEYHWFLSTIVSLFVLAGVIFGVFNLLLGVSVLSLHRRLKKFFRAFLFRRVMKLIGGNNSEASET